MSENSSDSTEIRIRWERRAVNEVAALPKTERRRVVDAVEGLREDPLKGTILRADWKGFRRLRAGSYRIIYAYQGRDLMISVVRIGHCSEGHR
jgi:addiction module RelE/StbE family toxin